MQAQHSVEIATPSMQRRTLLALAFAPLLHACADSPASRALANIAAEQAVLAPTGTLRVGVYLGSPTSMVRLPGSSAPAGVALELGQAMARELGVPVQVQEFARLALVLQALKAGQVDFTFTHATEVRARDMDFSQPLLKLELGVLVPGRSPLRSFADLQQPGLRVGVSDGSSSERVLLQRFPQVRLLTAASLEQAAHMLRDGAIDAFATNKGILSALAQNVPGAQVLPEHWGYEELAVAVPKGRTAAAPWIAGFAQRMQSTGQLQAMVQRSGLRDAVLA